MRDPDPKAVVRRFVEEVLSGEGEGPMADLVANNPLQERVAVFKAAFPDLVVTIQEAAVDNDLVAVHLTGRGTHEGLFEGCPPTGRWWAASCTAIYRVAEGRITDFWVNWDLLSILEQIGAVKRVGAVSA